MTYIPLANDVRHSSSSPIYPVWHLFTSVLLAVLLTAGQVGAQESSVNVFMPIEPDLEQQLPNLDVADAPRITPIRSRLVSVAFEQLAAARNRTDAAGTATLAFNLFDDDERALLLGVIEHTEATALGTGYTLSGRLEGTESGEITLLVYDDTVAGTFRTADTTYTIRPVGNGAHAIIEIAIAELPPLAEPLLPPSSDADSQTPEANPRGTPDVVVVTIDVAVFYTPAAQSGAPNLPQQPVEKVGRSGSI